MMRAYSVAGSFIMVMTFGIYLLSAIQLDTPEICNVAIDAGKPLHVVWPFEVAVVGDTGERGLRIGPKIGRGWKGEAGGSAQYRFYIPRDGHYTLWAYSFWHDACTNAVFAQIDDMRKVIIGNDSVMNQWHWVRGVSFDLRRGTHTLEMSNHSDNVAVQKIFFTNSPQGLPDKATSVFADIFYDGFDGCDQGNFNQWEKVSGDWQARNPYDARNTAQNLLIGKSNQTAILLLKNDQWSDYRINLSIQLVEGETPEAIVGVYFGWISPEQYCQFKCRYSRSNETGRMQIIRHHGGQAVVLAEFQAPWPIHKWHEVEIGQNHGHIEVSIDQRLCASVQTQDELRGGIGLSLEERTTAYFDNVHIRQAEPSPELAQSISTLE